MILEHWSSRSHAIDVSRISGEGFRRRDKPTGFWVSVAGLHDWPAYLAQTGYGAPAYRHRIELAPDARILRLDSVDALLDFSVSHRLATVWGEAVPPGDAIDWDRVEREWQGIVITPFQHSLRRDPRTRWYYGWDCASGCIWDAAAIAGITRQGRRDA
jgi:hypothetical protein